MPIIRIAAILFLFLPNLLLAQSGELVLGYPEREKYPLISEAPSDSGAYQEIFSKAAQKVGLSLRIVRLPKKRLFQEMEAGRIDVYPGSFSEDRAATMNWINTGIQTQNMCLTLEGIPTITDLAKAPTLRLLLEPGDSKFALQKTYPNLVPTTMGGRVDLEQAINFLKGNRGDLFIIEQASYAHYLRRNKIASAANLGLKAHFQCYSEVRPIYLGISRRSTHYRDIPNPSFKANLPLNVLNMPTIVDPTSTVGRLAQTLRQMKDSGETAKIVDKHVALAGS